MMVSSYLSPARHAISGPLRQPSVAFGARPSTVPFPQQLSASRFHYPFLPPRVVAFDAAGISRTSPEFPALTQYLQTIRSQGGKIVFIPDDQFLGGHGQDVMEAIFTSLKPPENTDVVFVCFDGMSTVHHESANFQLMVDIAQRVKPDVITMSASPALPLTTVRSWGGGFRKVTPLNQADYAHSILERYLKSAS
jgi:hypothetical protein